MARIAIFVVVTLFVVLCLIGAGGAAFILGLFWPEAGHEAWGELLAWCGSCHKADLWTWLD